MIHIKIDEDFSGLKIIKEFYRKIDSDSLLIFDTTWAEHKDFLLIDDWCEKNLNGKVYVSSLFDPEPRNLNKILKLLKHRNKIKLINHENVWLHMLCYEPFIVYTDDEVIPYEDFTFDFLCYQRKVYPHREQLYEMLKDKNGIITIGSKEFPEINKDLPDHIGWIEGGNLPVKVGNDIYSLGNLNVWKSCFLNIVSETYQDLKQAPFVGEKTLKPIFGMRPFIVYGNPQTSNFLKSKGFETFDDDFGYVLSSSYDEQSKKILYVVNELKNCKSFYKKLLPKIKHNREQFKIAAEFEWKSFQVFVDSHQKK